MCERFPRPAAPLPMPSPLCRHVYNFMAMLTNSYSTSAAISLSQTPISMGTFIPRLLGGTQRQSDWSQKQA